MAFEYECQVPDSINDDHNGGDANGGGPLYGPGRGAESLGIKAACANCWAALKAAQGSLLARQNSTPGQDA